MACNWLKAIACTPASKAAHEEISETKTIPRKSDRKTCLRVAADVTVHKYPIGYPLQAAFQSSESSWSIYRGFSYLHSRVILELQDEIRCLEQKLMETEEMDLENGDGNRLRSRSSDFAKASRDKVESIRASLLQTIQGKLLIYGLG